MRLLLGSRSSIKRTAVLEAFGDLVHPEDLVCYASSSGVPEQPIGQEQTREGAFNRARDARRHCGADYDYVIGIENGIWEDGEGWVDGACLCLLPRSWNGTNSHDNLSHSPIFLWSDLLAVPPVHERPFGEGPNGEWSVLKDPHAILTEGRRPRAEFLKSALVPFVETFRSNSSSFSTQTL